MILTAMLATGLNARSAVCTGCGEPNTVRDWGLHRVWSVERDRRHPERPAMLIEIPWDDPSGARQSADCGAGDWEKRRASALPVPEARALEVPEVRTGMEVKVLWRDENALIELRGTALGTARIGERVSVMAGLRGDTLTGVVRGPALVERMPAKEKP